MPALSIMALAGWGSATGELLPVAATAAHRRHDARAEVQIKPVEPGPLRNLREEPHVTVERDQEVMVEG